MNSTKKKSRMTEQRRIILEEIRQVDSHPTADEVYELVRRRIPRVSLGTIYRNLEQMADQDQVRRLEWAGTPRRYDGNLSEHHHLRCLACGAIRDLETESWRGIETRLFQDLPGEIVGVRMEFTGYCPHCRGEHFSPNQKVEPIRSSPAE